MGNRLARRTNTQQTIPIHEILTIHKPIHKPMDSKTQIPMGLRRLLPSRRPLQPPNNKTLIQIQPTKRIHLRRKPLPDKPRPTNSQLHARHILIQILQRRQKTKRIKRIRKQSQRRRKPDLQ